MSLQLNSISKLNKKLDDSLITSFMANKKDDEENSIIQLLNNKIFKQMRLYGGLGKTLSAHMDPSTITNISASLGLLTESLKNEDNENPMNLVNAGLAGMMIPGLIANTGKQAAKDINTQRKREVIAQQEGSLSNADRLDSMAKSLGKISNLGMMGFAANNLLTPFGHGSEMVGDTSAGIMKYTNPLFMASNAASGVGVYDTVGGITGLDPSLVGMIGMMGLMKYSQTKLKQLSDSTRMNNPKLASKLPVFLNQMPASAIQQKYSMRPQINSVLNTIPTENYNPIEAMKLNLLGMISDNTSNLTYIHDLLNNNNIEKDFAGGNSAANTISSKIDTNQRNTNDQLKNINQLSLLDKSILSFERFTNNLNLLNPLTNISSSLRFKSGTEMYRESNNRNVYLDPMRAEKDMGRTFGLSTQSISLLHSNPGEILMDSQNYESKHITMLGLIANYNKEMLWELLTIRKGGFGITTQAGLGYLERLKNYYENKEFEENKNKTDWGIDFFDNNEIGMMIKESLIGLDNVLGKIPVIGGIYSSISNAGKFTYGLGSKVGNYLTDSFSNNNNQSGFSKIWEDLKTGFKDTMYESYLNPLLKDEQALNEKIGNVELGAQELANKYMGEFFPDEFGLLLSYNLSQMESLEYIAEQYGMNNQNRSLPSNLSWDKMTGKLSTAEEQITHRKGIYDKLLVETELQNNDSVFGDMIMGLFERFTNTDKQEEVDRIISNRYSYIDDIASKFDDNKIARDYNTSVDNIQNINALPEYGDYTQTSRIREGYRDNNFILKNNANNSMLGQFNLKSLNQPLTVISDNLNNNTLTLQKSAEIISYVHTELVDLNTNLYTLNSYFECLTGMVCKKAKEANQEGSKETSKLKLLMHNPNVSQNINSTNSTNNNINNINTVNNVNNVSSYGQSYRTGTDDIIDVEIFDSNNNSSNNSNNLRLIPRIPKIDTNDNTKEKEEKEEIKKSRNPFIKRNEVPDNQQLIIPNNVASIDPKLNDTSYMSEQKDKEKLNSEDDKRDTDRNQILQEISDKLNPNSENNKTKGKGKDNSDSGLFGLIGFGLFELGSFIMRKFNEGIMPGLLSLLEIGGGVAATLGAYGGLKALIKNIPGLLMGSIKTLGSKLLKGTMSLFGLGGAAGAVGTAGAAGGLFSGITDLFDFGNKDTKDTKDTNDSKSKMSDAKNNTKTSVDDPKDKQGKQGKQGKQSLFKKLGSKGLKAVPFLGNVFSFGSMAKNLVTGNFKEAGSDAISMLPGVGNAWTAYTIGSDIKDVVTENIGTEKPNSSKATENINKTNENINNNNNNDNKTSKKSSFFKNLLKYGLPAYVGVEILDSLFGSDEKENSIGIKSNDYKNDYNIDNKLNNDTELNKTKEEIRSISNKNNSTEISDALSKTLDKDKEMNDKKFEAFRNDLKEIKDLLIQLINVSGTHAEISNISAKASQIIAENSITKDFYEHNSNFSFEFQN